MDSFERTNAPIPACDLAVLLGLDMTEDNAIFFSPKPDLPRLEMSTNPMECAEFQGRAFTKNPKVQGGAIVFRDSFGNALMPFLGYDFGKVTYLWQYAVSARWIELEKPDVVISEMVEREFNVADPNSLKTKEALK